MSQSPAGTRRYDSSRRREQAATTRRDILDAAERLFARDGYRSTTMAALAAEAGVSARTVYVAFATKSGVLRALWNARLRGEDDDVPVAERAWYREVLDEPDPVRRLRLNARNSRVVKTRLGPVLDLMRDAASVNDEIAALWSRIESQYRDNQRAVLEPLHARGLLREGLRPRDRHPLGGEPPEPMGAAGGRARLDTGGVRVVVRGARLRAAAAMRRGPPGPPPVAPPPRACATAAPTASGCGPGARPSSSAASAARMPAFRATRACR